jgi:hypothetical protein
MRNLGMFIVGVSLAWLIYAFFFMETTVHTDGQTIGYGDFSTYVPAQDVYNLGLQEQRRNHLMLAGLGLLVGTIMIGFGTVADRKSGAVACPECAELIQPQAIKCRFCGAVVAEPAPDIPDTESESNKVAIADELGVVRQDDRYYFLHLSFDSLEDATAYARAHSAGSA